MGMSGQLHDSLYLYAVAWVPNSSCLLWREESLNPVGIRTAFPWSFSRRTGHCTDRLIAAPDAVGLLAKPGMGKIANGKPLDIRTMKANEMHYFWNLFDKALYMFRTGPLSIIGSTSTHYTRNRCIVCWDTSDDGQWVNLSETCKVLYQINLRNSASRWLSL